MKHASVPLIILSLAFVGSQVLADDSPTARPNQTEHDLMKQCIADQKAKHADASAAELKKTCKEQIKTYQQHPSETTPSKVPVP